MGLFVKKGRSGLKNVIIKDMFCSGLANATWTRQLHRSVEISTIVIIRDSLGGDAPMGGTPSHIFVALTNDVVTALSNK